MARRPWLPAWKSWPKPWQLARNATAAFRSARLKKNVEARFRFAVFDPGPHCPGRAAAAVKLEVHSISRRQRQAGMAGAKAMRRHLQQAPDEWGGHLAGPAQADVSLSRLTGFGAAVSR